MTLLFSDLETCREEEAQFQQTCNTSQGHDHKTSQEIVTLALPCWDLYHSLYPPFLNLSCVLFSLLKIDNVFVVFLSI